jgi:adenylate cyclase
MAKKDTSEPDNAWWEAVFLTGDPTFRRIRAVMRRAPSSPRCEMCLAPFGGVGGWLLKFGGFAPSRMNPRICNRCFEEGPLGGVEMEACVLFGDVRGYTSMSERMSPKQVAALMNRFYAVATDVLTRRHALIDKLAGDQVMALFLPGVADGEHLEECASASQELLEGLGYGKDSQAWLPVGIGIDVGPAWVGNVGTGGVKDFTALGDVVNTAARLQAQALAGQIVLSERMYARVSDRFPGARSVELELKGKEAPVAARVVDLRPVAARA